MLRMSCSSMGFLAAFCAPRGENATSANAMVRTDAKRARFITSSTDEPGTGSNAYLHALLDEVAFGVERRLDDFVEPFKVALGATPVRRAEGDRVEHAQKLRFRGFHLVQIRLPLRGGSARSPIQPVVNAGDRQTSSDSRISGFGEARVVEIVG